MRPTNAKPNFRLLLFALLLSLLLAGSIFAQGTPDIVWSVAATSNINAVAYAPDGQSVLSGHGDRISRLFQASNGTLLRSLSSNSLGCGGANDVAYSPDGQYVAAITGCDIRIWRISDGTLVRRIMSGGGANASNSSTSLAFSPDGQMVAAATSVAYRTGTVVLWRVADGVQVRSLTGGGGGGVAFSPSGEIIASISSRRGLDMWNVSDGTLVRNIPGPNHGLAFSPDGQLIASAGQSGGSNADDDTMEIYRVSDGTLARRLFGTDRITNIVFTPDGQDIVTGGYNNIVDPVRGYVGSYALIRFWRLSDGAVLKTYRQGTGDPNWDLITGPALSPDGSSFVYGFGNSSAISLNVARTPALNSSCTFNLDAQSAVFDCEGGTGSIHVTAAAGCAWTAVSSAPWITITSGASGTGNGTVSYSVANNGCQATAGSNITQSGVMLVAEQNFNVTQKLAPPLPPPAPVGSVLISEFRFHGPTPTFGSETNGAYDEFIELYNNTDSTLIMNTPDNSSGWSLAASDGVVRATLPNGTRLGPRGHYLLVLTDNTRGYTLSSYASLDGYYMQDIPDDAGIALFRTSNPANFSLANRMDAVGFNTVTNSLYREGAGLPFIGSTDGEYSFVRKISTSDFHSLDTNDNAADFVFVSTTGGVYNGVQSTLGAPGPENAGRAMSSLSVASPQTHTDVTASLIDPLTCAACAPNRYRNPTPLANAAAGTLSIRRHFTNNTGATISRLRFRVLDITTLGTPAAGPTTQADLRLVSSSDETINTSLGALTIKGTSLEQAALQALGGGLNSSVMVALPDGGLANGQSIDVQFLLNAVHIGGFRFFVDVEAAP
jgi:WD40 repeat protein